MQVQEKISQRSIKYVCTCKRRSHSKASSMCASARGFLIAWHQVRAQVQEKISVPEHERCSLTPPYPTLPRRTLAKPCKSTCKGHITPPCLYAKLRTNCACLPCRVKQQTVSATHGNKHLELYVRQETPFETTGKETPECKRQATAKNVSCWLSILCGFVEVISSCTPR